MKAIKLLESVLYYNETEQQGIAVSGLFETQVEFVERWFGECVINGGYKNDIKYLYSYVCELMECGKLKWNENVPGHAKYIIRRNWNELKKQIYGNEVI